jgi:hypothetical protein
VTVVDMCLTWRTRHRQAARPAPRRPHRDRRRWWRPGRRRLGRRALLRRSGYRRAGRTKAEAARSGRGLVLANVAPAQLRILALVRLQEAFEVRDNKAARVQNPWASSTASRRSCRTCAARRGGARPPHQFHKPPDGFPRPRGGLIDGVGHAATGLSRRSPRSGRGSGSQLPKPRLLERVTNTGVA